jgi:amino acid transporter
MTGPAVAYRDRAARRPMARVPRDVAPADDAGRMGTDSVRLPGIVAQSVGAMGVTGVVALVVPLIVTISGSGAWLTLVLASVVMLCVAWCIARLASQLATTGGAYGLASTSLGRFGGVFVGWTTLSLFALFSAGTLAGFGIYATQFLSVIGLVSGHMATDVLYIVGIGASFIAAVSGLRRSAGVMLALEVLTGLAILILMVAVLAHHPGSPVDHTQLTLRHSSLNLVLDGFVLAVLAFAGFETATVLGRETANPRRTIPVALIVTVVIAGIFWTFCGYTIYLGFEHSHLDLATSTAPLGDLATLAQVGWLRTPIDVTVSLTLFGSLIALFNGLSRVLFTMARDGLAPRSLLKVHPRWGTPWMANVAIAAVWAITVTVVVIARVNPFTIVNDFGDVNGYAYMVIYATLAIGALAFLRRRRALRAFDVVAAVVSVVVLAYVFYENASDPTSDGWIFYAVLATFATMVGVYLLIGALHRSAFDRVGTSVGIDTQRDA